MGRVKPAPGDDAVLGQVRHDAAGLTAAPRQACANAARQSMRTRTGTGVLLRGELTDAEWQPIKDSLAAVGKDADQLTAPTIIKGGPLLRKALPLIADSCVLDGRLKKRAPTLKQAAAQLQETLRTASGLLERLSDRSNYDWLNPYFRQMLFRESQARDELLMALKGFIAELEYRLEVLVALEAHGMVFGSPRRTNASKVRNQFLRELTYLWQSFDPNAGKFKRRHLQRFLFACSKPFFPNVTDTKIAAFVDHYFSNQQMTIETVLDPRSLGADRS